MLRKPTFAALAALLVIAMLPTAASAEPTVEDVDLTSPADGITIAITVYKPDAASAENKVPVILFSHGWGGDRGDGAGASQAFLDANMGYIAIDQRGHGESGGLRNVQDPALEAQDIKAVIDYAASLDWVAHNTTIDPLTGETVEIPNDPILGAIGGSYGGGYQTITALTEIDETGSTRFDALAPEITWFDLPTSLAPQGVPRTAWTTLLYAVAKVPENKIAEYIDTAFAYGAASGHFPGSEPALAAAEVAAGVPNLTEIFRSHSPSGFVQDGQGLLDIPTLFRQGITDNLFNLNEGINNFQQTLTDEARNRSLFVGYNGGHVIPQVGNTFPVGTQPGGSAVTGGASGDPCSDAVGGWGALRIEFFKAAFAGQDPTPLLPGRYNLATNDGACLSLNSLGTLQAHEIDPTGQGGWGTPVGVFAPHHYELIEGPVTVAGIPRFTGEILNAGVDTRAFFALSVGASPTAVGPGAVPDPAPRVIQNNMTALRKLLPHAAPSTDGQAFNIELPGVAIEIPAGQSLYLTISPISDASFGHGSKTPGLMVITDMTVRVPVVPNAQ